jgi:hypothetical protein
VRKIYDFFCNCKCISKPDKINDHYIREIISVNHDSDCVFLKETISETLENDTICYNHLHKEALTQKINQLEKDKSHMFNKLFGRCNDIELTLSYYGAFVYLNETIKIANSILNPQPEKKTANVKTSYKWHSNPDKELPELHKLMIGKYKLIAPETTYEQFEAVFTGQAIESISPIKWHQDNASELLYFNEAIKDKVNDVWHIYQRLAACFVKPDGKQFNAVWKSLKTNIEINLSPEKQEAIDELVNNF